MNLIFPRRVQRIVPSLRREGVHGRQELRGGMSTGQQRITVVITTALSLVGSWIVRQRIASRQCGSAGLLVWARSQQSLALCTMFPLLLAPCACALPPRTRTARLCPSHRVALGDRGHPHAAIRELFSGLGVHALPCATSL